MDGEEGREGARGKLDWYCTVKKKTDLKRKCYVRGIRPTILLPVQPGRRLARMARVEGDEVVRCREAWVLELCGEPGRVEELGMKKEDGRFGRIEAAHRACRRIGDIPKRGVVVMRVRQVDIWHVFCLLLWSVSCVSSVRARGGLTFFVARSMGVK